MRATMAPPTTTVLTLRNATTISITLCTAPDENRDVHIVYMGGLPKAKLTYQEREKLANMEGALAELLGFHGVQGKANLTSRDTIGHDSHTVSTVAGNLVNGTNFLGLAKGKLKGAVPTARIVVYEGCWEEGCEDSDILVVFDHTISDGVDIISLSLWGDSALDYSADAIAIGVFNVM
ncbi:hypothetical protein GIB67_010339 [Kingdonia uniflora]|uniref:Peptidase S8/S53 domain-containing protein n=1 Tax=Kingdonia uniflora TaxID=39325 RepID=A0A7J7MA55_9MAGN|nr:hypothetical protein GIB67_010339 [Kingdonia uniflora]